MGALALGTPVGDVYHICGHLLDSYEARFPTPQEVTRSSEGAHAPFSSCKFSIV